MAAGRCSRGMDGDGGGHAALAWHGRRRWRPCRGRASNDLSNGADGEGSDGLYGLTLDETLAVLSQEPKVRQRVSLLIISPELNPVKGTE